MDLNYRALTAFMRFREHVKASMEQMINECVFSGESEGDGVKSSYQKVFDAQFPRIGGLPEFRESVAIIAKEQFGIEFNVK